MRLNSITLMSRDEDSELRLSIMSSIAQDELRKLSSRVKFGHQQAIKNNVVLGNSRIFGYRKEDRRLVIDEGQAPMVRELFELYATDQYSMKQRDTLFWEKGYRNLNGKKIAHTTGALLKVAVLFVGKAAVALALVCFRR